METVKNRLISQVIGNPALGSTGQQSGQSFISGLISALINLGFVAGSTIFLFILITGGIKWMSAGGDKGKLEEARGTVTNAVVGIAVMFSAYAILALVEYFFTVNLTVFDLESMRVGG